MMPIPPDSPKGFLKLAASFVIATGFIAGLPAANAQDSAYEFDGAPAPADYPQDEGMPPIDSYADALEMSESLQTEGVFEEKPYSLSFAIREGYDDNLFTTSTDTKSSFYTNWAAGVDYTASNPRFSLTGAVNGGATYYYTRPGNQFDWTGAISLNAAYQVSPRFTLTLVTNTAYLAQPDLTIAGGTNRQNGDYFYSATTIGGAYQWSEKFSTETDYTFTPFAYVDASLQDSQGRIEQSASQSFLWLVLPKTTAVLEYRVNAAEYFVAPLDNFGQYFLAGVDQVFSPKFTVTARAGAEYRIYNTDNNNPNYFGPAGELNLLYEYRRLSNVALNIRYSTEQSGLNGAATRQTFRIGANFIHAFTPKLSFNGGLNYLNNYYNEFNQPATNPDFYENIVEFAVGLNFKLNDNIVMQGGYTRTADMAPSFSGLSYNRNVYFVGLNSNF
jgi:hypothetical protein